MRRDLLRLVHQVTPQSLRAEVFTDAEGYFRGTLAEYLRLYDHAVAGAVAADPTLRIGGPGGAGERWLERNII